MVVLYVDGQLSLRLAALHGRLLDNAPKLAPNTNHVQRLKRLHSSPPNLELGPEVSAGSNTQAALPVQAYDSLLPVSPSSPTPLPSTSWQGPTQSAVHSFPEAPAPCPVLQLQTPRHRSSGEASNSGEESLITTSSGLSSPAALASPSVEKPDAPHIGGTAKDGRQARETATEDTSGLAVAAARPSLFEGPSSASGSGSQDLGQKADPLTASTVLDSPASQGREEARTEDASTGQRVDEKSRQALDAKPVAGMKAPPERKKVPFEKGFSQMDWLRLTQTHPDLAGRTFSALPRDRLSEMMSRPFM